MGLHAIVWRVPSRESCKGFLRASGDRGKECASFLFRQTTMGRTKGKEKMKRMLVALASALALAGCMVNTISKEYSADEVKESRKLRFNKVADLDDVETFDKSAIPVVVKSENKTERVYSPGGVHGLLWLCTLGIVPSWYTDKETHTMNVATPLGEKSGVCTITKRQYFGWVPYMLPFGASEADALCEEELLMRLISQWKKEWTAESVEKMNAENNSRIENLRAKADDLLAKKKWADVVKLCNGEKNKAFVSEYMPKALAVRLSVYKRAVDAAMGKKDYQRVVDLCKNEKDPELIAKRDEAMVNLIAGCADEAKLDELMKKYGAGLSVSQLAEIGKRTTNDIVRAKLVEMADNEIVKQIKAMGKGSGDDFLGDVREIPAADIQRFVELFGRLNTTNIRDKVLKGIAMPLTWNNDFLVALISKLTPNEILYVYEWWVEHRRIMGPNIGHDIAENFAKWIPEDKVLDTYSLFASKGCAPFLKGRDSRSFMSSFIKSDSNLLRIMEIHKNLPPPDLWFMADICSMAKNSSIVDKVFSDFKVSDYCYSEARNDYRKDYPDDEDKLKLVQMFAKKLGDEMKSKIIKDAERLANELIGKKIVFGPFYVGMSYLDALLLSNELGISDDVKIYADPAGKGTYGIREFATVRRIDFGNRAKFKFIDCDDAAALDQVIHQYVKRKSGKVEKFHYGKETRVETDKKIDSCWGYSNTQLGTKILFNDDTGVMAFIEL